MAADIDTSLDDWSTTESNNNPAGSTAISTNLDDNLRMIQAVVRNLASSTTIASASTTNLASVEQVFLTVTGTTSISAFGTLTAGMYKWLTFSGVLTLTHNATSLILPTGANITTIAGDTALVVSLGSGNWKCLSYQRVNGAPLDYAFDLNDLDNASNTNSITNSAYQQTWSWTFDGNSQTGMLFSGSSASNRTDTYVVTIAASDADVEPLHVTFNGESVFYTNAGASYLTAVGGATANVLGHVRSASDTGIGGSVNITGGPGYNGAGGSVAINAGANANAGGTRAAGGAIEIVAGTAVGSTGDANGGGIELKSGEGGGTGTDGDISLGVVGQAVFIMDGEEEHLYVSGAASPSVASGGGTGVAIAGSDNAFRVTIGTGSPTSVTVNFGTAWTTAPVAMAISSNSSANIYVSSCTTSQIVVNFSSGLAQNDIVHVMCMGYQ